MLAEVGGVSDPTVDVFQCGTVAEAGLSACHNKAGGHDMIETCGVRTTGRGQSDGVQTTSAANSNPLEVLTQRVDYLVDPWVTHVLDELTVAFSLN